MSYCLQAQNARMEQFDINYRGFSVMSNMFQSLGASRLFEQEHVPAKMAKDWGEKLAFAIMNKMLKSYMVRDPVYGLDIRFAVAPPLKAVIPEGSELTEEDEKWVSDIAKFLIFSEGFIIF